MVHLPLVAFAVRFALHQNTENESRKFTKGNNMVDYLEASDVIDAKLSPLWWHKQGLQQTASGYGRALKTEYLVRLQDKRWRRVLVCCYSNAGTAYVRVNSKWKVISDYGDVAEMLKALRV